MAHVEARDASEMWDHKTGEKPTVRMSSLRSTQEGTEEVENGGGHESVEQDNKENRAHHAKPRGTTQQSAREQTLWYIRRIERLRFPPDSGGKPEILQPNHPARCVHDVRSTNGMVEHTSHIPRKNSDRNSATPLLRSLLGYYEDWTSVQWIFRRFYDPTFLERL